MPPRLTSWIATARERLSRADALVAIPMFTSVALALSISLWVARSGDRDLGNGFELVRDKQVRYVLGPSQPQTPGVDPEVRAKSLAVPPNVTQLAQIGDVVTGLVEFRPACRESLRPDCGLFVIDTTTCECRLAMPQDQWADWLRDRGIDPATIRLRAL